LFFQQVGYGATATSKGVGLSPLQPAFSEDGGKELCYLLECIQHHPDEDVGIGPPEIPEPDFSPTVFDDIPPPFHWISFLLLVLNFLVRN
jgi:hypothetical protein